MFAPWPANHNPLPETFARSPRWGCFYRRATSWSLLDSCRSYLCHQFHFYRRYRQLASSYNRCFRAHLLSRCLDLQDTPTGSLLSSNWHIAGHFWVCKISSSSPHHWLGSHHCCIYGIWIQSSLRYFYWLVRCKLWSCHTPHLGRCCCDSCSVKNYAFSLRLGFHIRTPRTDQKQYGSLLPSRMRGHFQSSGPHR